MKANPKKSPQKNLKSIPLLEEKCLRLEKEIDRLQNKILKLENKNLKQEQAFLKLKKEAKLREERPMILVNTTHTKPPNS